MTDLQTTSAKTHDARPWNVETFEFQPPRFIADFLSSTPAGQTDRVPEAVTLVFDMRLVMAKQLLEEDERELGPISDDVLNEVRSRWLG